MGQTFHKYKKRQKLINFLSNSYSNLFNNNLGKQ